MTHRLRRPSLSRRIARVARVGWALAFVCASAASAYAQDPPPSDQEPLSLGSQRPGVTIKVPPRRLDFGLSLFEGYDLTTVTDGQPGLTVDPRIRQDSSFSGLSSSLTYSQPGDQKSFGAVVGSDFRYYSLAPTLLPLNVYGGLNFSAALRRRLRFSAMENLGYSPYYAFGSFLNNDPASGLSTDPSAAIRTPARDQSVVRLRTITSDSTASLAVVLTQKASLTGTYTLDYVDTPNTVYQVFTHGGVGAFNYRKTKYLTFRAGYGYHQSRETGQSVPSYGFHNIDVGVDYRRPLSFSRRTTVGFNVGTTMVTDPRSRLFTGTGNASLAYQLSRTWTTGVSYNRAVSVIGGIVSPFVNDTVSGSLGGLFTRHLGVNISGGFGRGNSAIGPQNGYDAVNGSARLHYDLTRYIPVYVEYVYYRYQFDVATGLGAGFPISLQRNGVRAGLGYTLPLIGRRPGER